LVVLPGGIGLVAHGLLGTPPFAQQTLTVNAPRNQEQRVQRVNPLNAE
jgi:hypothetical protein